MRGRPSSPPTTCSGSRASSPAWGRGMTSRPAKSSRPPRTPGSAEMFCPECGIRNSEGASFCVRCGASLIADQPESATTLSYVPGDEEGEPNALAAIAGDEACLVIRSGGGRAGETYPLRGERVAIGRHPDAAIFLDDVTVSRNHALVEREGDGWVIVDEGSLNGTYVNRRRGDRFALADGDEIQIGKYKLTFIILSLIHISEPTRLGMISYAVF